MVYLGFCTCAHPSQLDHKCIGTKIQECKLKQASTLTLSSSSTTFSIYTMSIPQDHTTEIMGGKQSITCRAN